MARYIDAERLKDAFHTDTEHLQSRDEHLFELIMFEIDEAPTADVVEVVRCKDCRRRVQHWPKCQGRRPDDYCCDGIRRTHNG